ncbi:MAG TPA: hypothetical protein VKA60_01955 [Blastocatellia bacterium]|nr:hypothetical protein [Blastocatellia bacterium]
MKLLLGILFGAAVLIAYVMIEKRLSQRACPVCGFQISADAANEPCPRCDALINPVR